MNLDIVITSLIALGSAVIVAVFNNWDKLNGNKHYVKDTLKTVQELRALVHDNQDNFKELSAQMERLSSAQRVTLQTSILADCRAIQIAIDTDAPYEEQLKQLIILYREYYLCGYNSQAKLYFNDIIEKASEVNNSLVHELMNTYFSEYSPH